jgi:hypothetical protein
MTGNIIDRVPFGLMSMKEQTGFTEIKPALDNFFSKHQRTILRRGSPPGTLGLSREKNELSIQ